jgi:hypothetical protein
VAFWAKMSRITAVRSMAVRPRMLLEVALLGRGELVVEHHRVGVERDSARSRISVGLALAHEGGRVRAVAPLGDAGDLVGAGGVDQQLELVERSASVSSSGSRRQRDAHEHDALPEGAVDERAGLAAELAEAAAVGLGRSVGQVAELGRRAGRRSGCSASGGSSSSVMGHHDVGDVHRGPVQDHRSSTRRPGRPPGMCT